MTKDRWWLVWSAAALVCIGLILAFPSYQDLSTDPSKAGKTWQAVLAKAENPGWNVLERFGASTNAARVNFRLTGPVLARVFHVGIGGLVAIQGICGVVLLGLCVLLANRISGDRGTALIAGAGVATTWAGVAAFCELRGVFDGIALCLLMCTLTTRQFAVAAVATFAACWTDERALVAFPLLVLSMLVVQEDQMKAGVGSRLRGAVGGAIAGVCAHIASRVWYGWATGIPHRFDGNGLEIAMNQINNVPMAIWSGLEGGWLIAGGGLLAAWMSGRRAWAAGMVGGMGLVLATSVAVVDISRTTAFLLPAFFAGLSIFKQLEDESSFRRFVLLSTVISMLWPMYYVGGKATIWWMYPLPIQFVRIVLGR